MAELLDNLLQGVAGAAGDTGTVNRIQQRKDTAAGLQHEELQNQTQSILNNVTLLQQKRARLDPQSSTYQQDLQQNDLDLHNARQLMTDLYHPQRNPDALSKLGGFIKQHILRQQPTEGPTPGAMKQSVQDRMAQTDAAAAGGLNTKRTLVPGQPYQKVEGGPYFRVERDPATGALSEEQMPEGFKPMAAPKAPTDYTREEKIYVKEHGGDPEHPTSELINEYRTGRHATNVTPKERRAWKREGDGSFTSVMLDDKNQVIPGTENKDLAPPSSMLQKVSTGFYHFQDEQGNVHQIGETKTSGPVQQRRNPATEQTPREFMQQPRNLPPGTGRTPGFNPGAERQLEQETGTKAYQPIPQTPGQAKAAVARTAPAGGGGDRVIGFKGNKDYQDTNKAYKTAIDRQKIMDQNLKDALGGNQQAMVSLVAQHVGMTAAAQPGMRITRATWEEAAQSAPWIDVVKAKWFHDDPQTGDMIFDGFKGGINLTPQQMQQMDQLAHEKVEVFRQHMADLDAQRTDPGAAAARARSGAPAGGAAFKVPAGAPPAPAQDGHKLKVNGQVIAISRGGQWVAP